MGLLKGLVPVSFVYRPLFRLWQLLLYTLIHIVGDRCVIGI